MVPSGWSVFPPDISKLSICIQGSLNQKAHRIRASRRPGPSLGANNAGVWPLKSTSDGVPSPCFLCAVNVFIPLQITQPKGRSRVYTEGTWWASAVLRFYHVGTVINHKIPVMGQKGVTMRSTHHPAHFGSRLCCLSIRSLRGHDLCLSSSELHCKAAH